MVKLSFLKVIYFKVAWIKADSKAILAIHDHVITNKDKIKVPELLITQYVEKPGHNFSQSITEEVKGWIISQDKNIIVLVYMSSISHLYQNPRKNCN